LELVLVGTCLVEALARLGQAALLLVAAVADASRTQAETLLVAQEVLAAVHSGRPAVLEITQQTKSTTTLEAAVVEQAQPVLRRVMLGIPQTVQRLVVRAKA
jgi:hypothetical protein